MKSLQLLFLALLFSSTRLVSQNVGIGTNTPGYPLTVVAQSAKGIVQKDGTVEVGFYTSSSGAYLQTWSNHPLSFSTNNASAQMILLTNGNVGIGVGSPVNRLQVTSSAASSANATIHAVNTGAVGNGIFGVSNAVGTNGVQGFSTSGTGVYGYSGDYRAIYGSTLSGTALYGYSSDGYGLQTVGKLKISGGNTNPSAGAVLTSLDATGNAVWKQTDKIGFKAYGISSGQAVIPDASGKRVHYGAEFFDKNNNYELLANGATPTANSSAFTVPVAGIYHFDVGSCISAAGIVQDIESATMILVRNRNGGETELARAYGNRTFSEVGGAEAPDAASFNISVTESLLTGDKIYVSISHSSGTTALLLSGVVNWFSGHLVVAD